MVPVDVYIAHEKKHWRRMPFDPLMGRLRELTKGRILQVDQPIADLPASVGDFKKRVREADRKKDITVKGPNDADIKRALYVEYELPL
jgi:hypothetical protein